MTMPEGWGWPAVCWVLWLSLAVVADTRSRRLSNRLVLAGALGALGLALAPGGLGLALTLQGGVIALLVFLPGWVLHQLGAGDVKLAAVCGLFAGADAVWGLCLAILLAGGVQALLWRLRLWLRQQGVWRAHPPAQLPAPASAVVAQRMPYAWAVAAGSVVHLLGWP